MFNEFAKKNVRGLSASTIELSARGRVDNSDDLVYNSPLLHRPALSAE